MSKLPTSIEQILALIQTAPKGELYHHGDVLRTAVERRQREWWGSPEQQEEQKQLAIKRARAAAKRSTLAARRADWAREFIQPGMIVKMTGTRDGHGVRYVMEVDRGTILCRQMSPTYRMGRTIDDMRDAYPNKRWVKMSISDEEGKYSIWEVTNAGTDHSLDKVAGVFKEDENGLLHYEAIK